MRCSERVPESAVGEVINPASGGSMQVHTIGLSLIMTLACPALTFGEGVTVVTAFPGNQGPGWKSSIDAAGAVGPRHVVAFDVVGFVAQDKASGKELQRFSASEFWQQVQPAGSFAPKENPNDSRIVYDPLSKRWFACAAGTTEPDCFLAVSTSDDPTQPWNGIKLPLPRINPYMKMGVDRNGLYVCSCNGHPDLQQAVNCYVIPKRDAVAEGGPVLDRAQTFEGLPLSTMPAMDPDPHKEPDAPAVLLANEYHTGRCGELYLYRIKWNGTRATISESQTVKLSRDYLTPDNSTPQMEAVQPAPGPGLRAGGGGRRLDCTIIRNGSVFGSNGAKRTSSARLGVLWYEIRISDGAVLQEGFVDHPQRDYIFPSVAVDGRGNVGIGCTGTSESEFPSIYVMMRAVGDAPGTMRTPIVAAPGTTYYHYAGARTINLSHYSTTCIDPSDPGLLWTYQAYSNSTVDKQWCTAWAAFRLREITE